MEFLPAGREISTILRHDRKQNTYKIALLRAINDVVLGFPDLRLAGRGVAVPLRTLAARWIAYFWPFADPTAPVWQGQRGTRGGVRTNDVAFRPHLEALCAVWEASNGPASPADGFFLVDALRVPRRRAQFAPALIAAYESAIRQIADTIGKNPVRYAGPGEYAVFDRPRPFAELDGVVPIPGTEPHDLCVVVGAELWSAFDALSLWVEALCIHEWCLFTETVNEAENTRAERGAVFRLLTARPDNRVSLSWERNQIDVLLQEGRVFVCPWTARQLLRPADYELDHLLPLAVYPVNDLWNLVPADARFNNRKRDLLPSTDRLTAALPRIAHAYTHYLDAGALRPVLRESARLRFSEVERVSDDPAVFAPALALATGRFIEHVASTRNVARF